ncbi:cell wall-binding repeat-containing protein [Catenulispora subtropica]|uniref:cell wall-binding repeat-containing protein n=1 Tax=Catenulispora subtropica TaxID=450798 RepID=UPI0031D39D0B
MAGAAFGGTLVSAPSASAASRVGASGADVVAINPALFNGSAPGGQVGQDLGQILRNSSRYLATTWYTSTYKGVASDGYLNLDIPGAVPEQSFRLPGMAALSIATAVKLNDWDDKTPGSISADEAANRAAVMVRALAHRYYANNSLAGVSTWGNGWQTPLWAFYTGQAAWLVWDKLSPSERDDVARMIANEADRLTTGNDVFLTSDSASQQLYQYKRDGTDVTPGDTKTEEDNYDAQLLGLAAAMMPNHPHAADWQRRNEDLLIATAAMPQDLTNTNTVNGRKLSDWLQGYNMQADGTVQNHDILHPLYMTALDQSLQQVGTFALGGQCAPQATWLNVDKLYNALTNQTSFAYAPTPGNPAVYANPPISTPNHHPIYEPGSADINYPQGNDWGTQFPAYYGSFDALVGVYNLAPNANQNAATHLDAEVGLQKRFGTGQTYVPWNPQTTPGNQAENSYVGAEQRVGQISAQAYMALWLNNLKPACFDNSGTPRPPNVPLPQPTAVSRISGNDRYLTGAAVSQRQWANAGGDATQRAQADAVVLARGDNFPDALAGVPLAKRDRGPLLLTESGTLNPATKAEILRILPKGKTVYILGGNVAVSPTVEGQLRGLGYDVKRFGGADRYATALDIANRGMGAPHQVIVATGLDFPDALAAGPLAAGEGNAILLSNGKTLDPATKAYIAAAQRKADGSADPNFHVNAVGGAAVAATSYVKRNPLMGADRYATAVAVAKQFAADMPVTQFGVATGMQFADALTGGAYMANAGQPLILTDPNGLSPADVPLLATMHNQISAVSLFGGPVAIKQAVMDQIARAVGGVEK